MPSRWSRVPRWAWDRYGEEGYYVYCQWQSRLYEQHQLKYPKPRIVIEWRIVGHEHWHDARCYIGDIDDTFRSWKRETDRTDSMFDTDYRMLWNGKVILEKRVPQSEDEDFRVDE